MVYAVQLYVRSPADIDIMAGTRQRHLDEELHQERRSPSQVRASTGVVCGAFGFRWYHEDI